MNSTSKLCHEGQQICRLLHRRNGSLDAPLKRHGATNRNSAQCRAYASSVAAINDKRDHQAQNTQQIGRGPLGQQAQQKQADREFFADLLSSAATKRDAKAYLNRLKSPPKTKPLPTKSSLSQSGSYVNVGNLFRGSRAAEMSPVFSQSPPIEAEFQQEETLHVALVKVRDIATLSQKVLQGIAETLYQLNRLSISPCILVEPDVAADRRRLGEEVDRLIDAINRLGDVARKVDNIFTIRSSEIAPVVRRNLLLRPLKRGQIPVLGPIAYDEDEHKLTCISAHNAMLALTKELAGLNIRQTDMTNSQSDSTAFRNAQKQVSLDRIITIDTAGGIPNEQAADGNHVFLNLEQEYDFVRPRLEAQADSPDTKIHLANLDLLNQALQMLPPTSSGLMTTHEEAANPGKYVRDHSASTVGTRRSKNTLIHNLLTDKPAYSSSLPLGRLSKDASPSSQAPSMSRSSFVKRGMPVTIFPNPFETPWTPTSPRLTLTDPRIDLSRLVYLIEDSFNRKLDVSDYLNRVNDRIAGIIIAGEYEGGAILTWEVPPNSPPNTAPIPYLDKFAVLKRSQGAGGVADILFNAMVRSCFPDGVCWRSRKDNPVNKWYFERSRGTWKIPDMNWTMFWTTPNVERDSALFTAYEGVCRGVKPSWSDTKVAAD